MFRTWKCSAGYESRTFNLYRIDHDVLDRPVLRGRLRMSDLIHDIHAFNDLAEDGMFVIQPRRRNERDEELTAVGVRPRICHRQQPRSIVFETGPEFVGELIAWTATAVAH